MISTEDMIRDSSRALRLAGYRVFTLSADSFHLLAISSSDCVLLRVQEGREISLRVNELRHPAGVRLLVHCYLPEASEPQVRELS